MTAKEKMLVAELKDVIEAIHWMARRYATGRHTYAPSMFNDAIRIAKKHGVHLKPDSIETPPTLWAEDGDYGWPKEHSNGN